MAADGSRVCDGGIFEMLMLKTKQSSEHEITLVAKPLL
jgi:hypothetical protein